MLDLTKQQAEQLNRLHPYLEPLDFELEYFSDHPTPGELNPDRLVLQPRMTNDVRFSELLPNGTMEVQAFPDVEWIELLNNGSSEVVFNG